MKWRRREIEAIVLAMFAALPLYFTYSIRLTPLIVFHAVMAAILLRVVVGKTPELIPVRMMRWLAIAYVPFYLVDWRLLSGSAMAASVHLVLFIAIYQPSESLQRDNHAQRTLTTALIFIAALATSTHITVVPFVIAFAFLMFRQLMYVSHVETVRSVEREYVDVPSGRAAAFYLVGAILIGAVLFPLLPRVRSPFVHGFSGPLSGSSGALSETIDFNEPRVATPDKTIVARVWMGPQARAFFTPIRLRGLIYDRFAFGEWRQTYRGLRDINSDEGVFQIARAKGVTDRAVVQMRPQRGKLFLPVGTYSFSGLPSRLYEGPAPETYHVYQEGLVTLTTLMAVDSEPLSLTRVTPPMYPITPQVAALAMRIVGNEQDPERRAAKIESYLSTNYRYVPNSETVDKKMSIDQFLLRDRAGHCEYFAAGMVVLLASVDVPARIAGGYYGGRYNPLGGYYAIRRDDAHAWTEVWNGTRWVTFDSTPPALRPGAQVAGAWREYLVGLADTMTFVWDRYVLTFGLGDQVSIAEDLIVRARDTAKSLRAQLASNVRELATPQFQGLAILAVAVGLALILLRRRRRPIFDALAAALAARDIAVGPAMTMEDALRRLRERHPEAAHELEPLVALYEEEVFSARKDRSRARKIRRRLAAMPRLS